VLAAGYHVLVSEQRGLHGFVCIAEILVFIPSPLLAIVQKGAIARLEFGFFHGEVERQQVGHRIGCAPLTEGERTAEEEHPPSFGQYPASSFGIVTEVFHEFVTAMELTGKEFGIASRQIDQIGLGEFAAIDGAETGDVADSFQLLDVLAMGEVEGCIAGHGNLDFTGRWGEGVKLCVRAVGQGVLTREIAVAEVEYAVDIYLLFNDFGYFVNLIVQLLSGCQSECGVLGWQLQIGGDRQIAQAVGSCIEAGFAQAVVMGLGGHHVEHNTGDGCVGMEVAEPIDEGGHGVACQSGIDQQNDGDVEQSGHLGTTALHLVAAIKESGCTFGNAYIGLFAIFVVHVLEVGVRSQPGVQMNGLVVGGQGEQLGIHEVGATLVGLYLQASSSE